MIRVAEFRGGTIPSREWIYACVCGWSCLHVAYYVGRDLATSTAHYPAWSGARKEMVERAVAEAAKAV